jgi:hypothetical protein
MNTHIIVALIAFSGVIISAIISVILSSLAIKAKIKEIKEKYSTNLHQERLKHYPKLYEITGGIGTLFKMSPDTKDISKKELNKYLERLINWDEKHALFGGPLVMEKLFNARRRLEEIVYGLEKTDLQLLYSSLQELEFEMKKEIGVFTSERFDSLEKNRAETYSGYEERFRKYRLTE